MSKVGVFYWSSTGNTQAMADAVADGARNAGAEVTEASVSEVDPGSLSGYDAVALGCPAMGSEQLEDGEFRPFFEAAAGVLSGKKVGLFGSYGWGDGQWMRDWEEECGNMGLTVTGTVMANNAPDDAAVVECNDLGAKLAA